MTPFRWWCQQNKLSPQWDYLIKFLSLHLANWSIYVETEESCCPKWSFSLTLSEIPWRFSSILPNVKISLTLCKIPWQFPDLEKFYFSLTFPWRLWTLEGTIGHPFCPSQCVMYYVHLVFRECILAQLNSTRRTNRLWLFDTCVYVYAVFWYVLI